MGAEVWVNELDGNASMLRECSFRHHYKTQWSVWRVASAVRANILKFPWKLEARTGWGRICVESGVTGLCDVQDTEYDTLLIYILSQFSSAPSSLYELKTQSLWKASSLSKLHFFLQMMGRFGRKEGNCNSYKETTRDCYKSRGLLS